MKPGFGMTNLMTRLEAVAGIDAKAEDGGDFYRLVVSHGGLEFPVPKGGEYFGGHLNGACIENPRVLDIAGSVEGAGYYHAGMRQTRG